VSKKVTNRFFVYGYIAVLSLFTVFHVLVWETLTKQLLAPKEQIHVGDLARMGYQLNSLQLRKTEVTLPKQHIQSSDYKGESVDIITFGDSFSIGAGGGLNPYYQDYIVTENNVSVLNIERDTKRRDEEYLNALIGIINGGFLNQVKPKIIILESVERVALVRLLAEVDWNATTNSVDVMKVMKNANHEGSVDVPIINSGNYKFFLYNLYYQFSHDALNRSSVYKYNLNRNLFCANAPKVLLHYNQDITSLGLVNEENVVKMNDNLNHLATLLAAKNIKLIFMPVVDKYDLYRRYMVDNTHEENKFFDLLRRLPKSYYFVDTKKILAPLVDNNVTDVFYADDTHWSYKASKAVISAIPFQQLLSGRYGQ
jgi:hypothetical protein